MSVVRTDDFDIFLVVLPTAYIVARKLSYIFQLGMHSLFQVFLLQLVSFCKLFVDDRTPTSCHFFLGSDFCSVLALRLLFHTLWLTRQELFTFCFLRLLWISGNSWRARQVNYTRLDAQLQPFTAPCIPCSASCIHFLFCIGGAL